MKHSIETKNKVIRLLNEGLNVKQVFFKTGVTEKTIAKWLRNWTESDNKKIEILNTLWERLENQSKIEKLNANEIKSITNNILKLKSKLSVYNKKIKNLKQAIC